ncbi:hypothetical protein [Methanobrevibacter curvatus]|uniref:Uncharacterized protein n=1 Tax=Methanobrevibacter curvatus TaxID=49547 RepID=A0A165Z2D7_9EURY|nr:hypothetical protein [Methanobrevibacter curvatus]KZX10163.1 hypothetical protein MBCUR_18980 [Methanobrevibacter curvatus]
MPLQRVVKLSKREALVKGLKGKTYTAIIQNGIDIPESPDTCFVEFIHRTPVISRFENVRNTLENTTPSGTTTLEMFY